LARFDRAPLGRHCLASQRTQTDLQIGSYARRAEVCRSQSWLCGL